MKWQGRRTSTNVEDRRSSGSRTIIGGSLGIGTIVIAIIIALLGGNPADSLPGILSPATEQTAS